ncbi:hypothetical protein HDG32_001911 [Paraburkholderia sp. CI2]|uniref:hypothetical protein n=1 Tax=unclassified Paraburkholderia TaxID=2615204 RepID=UPI001616D637|nr:hypothetical protein [Paraburkholderia sp. CI2]MBB5465804.1 hypothetical protein [Paraburkholderia sp. CI2]
MLLPSFVTNEWQLFAGSGVRALVERLGPMLAGIVLGTLVAAARSARACATPTPRRKPNSINRRKPRVNGAIEV